jgi:hypothetical protein
MCISPSQLCTVLMFNGPHTKFSIPHRPTLIHTRKYPVPPAIRKLHRAIHIRPTLAHKKQHGPRNVIMIPHASLRDLIRAVRRRNPLCHLTRIRAGTHDVAADAPLGEERRHHLAHVRGGGLGRVVREPRGDPAHVGRDASHGDDVRHAVVIRCCACGSELGRVVRARVAGAADPAGREAATCVSGFEEREEDGGDADDGLRVDGEGAGPVVPAGGHGVAELRDGFGFVDALAALGADDAGIVDQDVDVAGFLLDLGCGGFDRLEVGHVAGYGGEDGGGFWCGRRRLEGLDGVLEDVEAATEDVYFCGAILVQSRCDCESNACYGKSLSRM